MRDRLRSRHVVTHVVLMAGALLMVSPFLWQFLTSLKTLAESTRIPLTFLPASPEWANYSAFFDVVPVWSMAVNSVLALVLRVVGQLLVASLAAYVFARLRFRFRGPLLAGFLVVLMVPPQLFVIPQYEVIRTMGWLNSVQALALPGMFSAFGVFVLYQFMRTLPQELDEAARMDGANPFQIYLRIILPLCRPALAALTILTSLFSWNDLLWPLIVNTVPDRMTLPVGLATLQGAQGTDYPVLMAGSLLTILPMVLVFVLLQKQFIRGIAMSGIKA
ncbi:carbohydrate ABC transporter permease [Jiangella alkaliphila]|uniref:Carbohydrate ABC transporter membrane protein 2, CUT1 family n=1 Tax=Jiangella alkaliphila TaxID=419479 RepID=A0A1H2KHQ4_9ACTN|nr:carbohydrate ABC transporter permease [Jiangella alkaliphila]SDU67926.1 carbohydrate ABC transporter membrane protein 2, CUT1 family [Jiangella alkaliphila]